MARKWTVAIIMVTDGLRWFEYNDLEQSILNVVTKQGIDKINVEYLIFFHDQTFGNNYVKELVAEDGYFSFAYKNVCQPQKDLGEAIANFLANDIAKDTRLMIINWGHGAGLGFFTSKKNNCTSEETRNSGKKALAAKSFALTYFPEIFNAEKKTDNNDKENLVILSAFELASIYKNGLKNRKAEILLNINCYVQMIEVGLEFCGIAEYMIAPQTSIPFTGINYEYLFHSMEKTPDVPSEIVIEYCLGRFEEKYAAENFVQNLKTRSGDPEISDVSISAIRLDEQNYTELINLIEAFACYLLKILNPEIIGHIEQARANCETFGTNDEFGCIDLTYFLFNLNYLVQDPVINGFYQKLKIIRKSIVERIYYASRENYSSIYSTRTIASPFFISIFFPKLRPINLTIVGELKKLYLQPDKHSVILKSWRALLIELKAIKESCQ